MTTYTPDCWKILRITSVEYGANDKILCSWYGGYAGSDSWKLSSGIVSVSRFNERIEFLNASGSLYVCYHNSEKMSSYMSDVLNGFLKDLKDIHGASADVIDLKDYK